MTLLNKLVLLVVIGASFVLLHMKGQTEMLWIMAVLVGLLSLFSIIWRVMEAKEMAMGPEIRDRTITWWWMVAVFMLALSTHRMVSFLFLGFLSFAALREYETLLPMHDKAGDKSLSFKDRGASLASYLALPTSILLAYIEWYNLFLILVPVYVFLLIPILFILQNRTQGCLKSMGIIALGFMFFVHNFGHCLFMINMGPIVLMYCIALTEARDLLSFWVGKGLARRAAAMPEGKLRSFLDRKIAAEISPKKTWAAGLVSAVLIALLSLVFVPLMPDFPDGRMSYAYSALVGFMIGMLGLFGDLAFSMVKRDIGVKDSGSSLPGHGGIIDRIDSLVFTVPIVFHLIYWQYF
ncbi:MAG: phosphatidate cytidylyltransferase [Halodesulfovibrio sp.]